MPTRVYVCTWKTGTATFYVDERPGHQSRVISYRSPEADDPEQSVMIREALKQLNNHLNPPYRPAQWRNRADQPSAVSELVWFPSSAGELGGIAS